MKNSKYKLETFYVNTLIIVLVVFLLFTINSVIDKKLESITIEVDDASIELEQIIKEDINTIEFLQIVIKDKYATKNKLDLKYANQIHKVDVNDSFALDIENIANVTGFGGLKNDKDILYEMEMSINLTKYMKKIYELNANYAWIYYVSKNQFQSTYPYTPSTNFMYSRETREKPLWKMALKKNNPDANRFFTPLYLDELGLGLMVTLGKPLYKDNQFFGTIDMDITLESQSKFFKKKNLHNGTYFIVNKEQQIIAADGIEKFNTKSIFLMNDIVNKEISSISSTNHKLKLVGDNYIYVIELENTPWKMYYYKNKYEIYLELVYYIATILFIILILFKVKQLLKNLKIAQREADKANAMKSVFLANMSHEIRTPMNSVIGFSDLLQNTTLDSKQEGYVKSIKAGGKSLLTLINDILDISKIEAGKFELEDMEVDVRYIVNDINVLFHAKCKAKGILLNIEIADDIPNVISSDEVRIRQILINLISNAIKFTDKGSVTLKVEYKDEKNLIFSVRDTGIGIAKKEQGFIFEAFAQQLGQSNKQYGGTGLGLSISNKLAKLLNGSIHCESDGKNGSSFIFCMDDIKVLDTTIKRVVDDENIIFNKQNILIADDVNENIILLKDMLERLNLNVTSSINGQDAYDKALLKKFDAVITDIRMPIMGGVELFRKLKELDSYKNIPIMAATASIMKDEKDKLLKNGFEKIIEKPIELKKLKNHLKDYLAYTILDDDKSVTTEITQESTILTDVSEKLYEKFEEAIKSGMIDDIEDFALYCQEVGDDTNDENLINYATLLKQSIDDFDIEAMEILKQKFKNMGKINE